jgi:hypothetical protein
VPYPVHPHRRVGPLQEIEEVLPVGYRDDLIGEAVDDEAGACHLCVWLLSYLVTWSYLVT